MLVIILVTDAMAIEKYRLSDSELEALGSIDRAALEQYSSSGVIEIQDQSKCSGSLDARERFNTFFAMNDLISKESWSKRDFGLSRLILLELDYKRPLSGDIVLGSHESRKKIRRIFAGRVKEQAKSQALRPILAHKCTQSCGCLLLH